MTDPGPRTYTTEQLREELRLYHQELVEAGHLTPSTIGTYVQHPERFISYLEGRYNPKRRSRGGRRGRESFTEREG